MKRLPLLISFLLAVGIPLWRAYLDRRRRRSRLQTVTDAARERAVGFGESAWGALSALVASADAAVPRDAGSSRRAVATDGFAGRAGAAVAAVPRMVAQFQAGAGMSTQRNEDWREYGEVFR